MEKEQSKFVPIMLAIAVHIGLAVFLVFSMSWNVKPERAPSVDVVQATMITETESVSAAQAQQQKAEEDKKLKEEEQKREEELKRQEEDKKRVEEEQQRKVIEEKKRVEEEQKRQAEEVKRQEEVKQRKLEEEKKRVVEEEKKRKLEDEKKRQAEEEKKRKEEEKKRKEELEKKRKAEEEKKRREAAEDALSRQLAEEAEALDSASKRRAERASAGYVDAIRQDVQRSWRKPPGASPDMECVVRVRQAPSGEVIDAQIISCTTNDENFKRSVVQAVFKASPLPKPADASVFQSDLEFKFNPQE